MAIVWIEGGGARRMNGLPLAWGLDFDHDRPDTRWLGIMSAVTGPFTALTIGERIDCGIKS